ncbi:MAG: hypothetical protein QXX83_09235 [Thermofilum sp.]
MLGGLLVGFEPPRPAGIEAVLMLFSTACERALGLGLRWRLEPEGRAILTPVSGIRPERAGLRGALAQPPSSREGGPGGFEGGRGCNPLCLEIGSALASRCDERGAFFAGGVRLGAFGEEPGLRR